MPSILRRAGARTAVRLRLSWPVQATIHAGRDLSAGNIFRNTRLESGTGRVPGQRSYVRYVYLPSTCKLNPFGMCSTVVHHPLCFALMGIL